MTKKLLALFLAVSMIFSVCAVGAFAEETGEIIEPGDTTEPLQPEEETTLPEEEEDEDVPNSVDLDLENSYLPNATVVVKGTINGNVSGVIVKVYCEADRFEYEETFNKSKFEATGAKVALDGASVGEEYIVEIYNFDDEDELLAEDSFLIRKSSNSSSVDDGSNKVTIWVEGLTERYVDEIVVNLDWVKKPTVLEVAKYVLDEADRNYKSNKYKITAIASTATGTTYTLKDNNTTKNYKDCTWAYILNGEYADYDGNWTDEVKGGDEIVLFYGVPGEVGYPVIEINPKVISEKEDVTITVINKIFGEDGEVISEEPIEKGKVWLIKRGATSRGTAKSTNSDGECVIKASTVTSSWISTYQGGEVMVGGYQSSSKPLTMVSAVTDLKTDREGTVQAYVRIEGAHKTLLSRTKSAKIDEFDLYNFMVEVLEDEDIEYETNDDETNFTMFESNPKSGYYNENGDITRDSGWYVAVNDEIYTPDDDLEEVEIFPNDEILFYFGDNDTVPVVYFKVDGDLQTDKKVYVYFYSNADMTNPIEDLEVNFSGDDVDKDLETNSDGRIQLPAVKYRGTYTLSWGNQVGVRDDECPKAVLGKADLKYTGTTNTSTSTGGGSTSSKGDDDDDELECEYCGDSVTRLYTIEYKNRDIEVCKDCRNELIEEEDDDEKWTTEPEEDTTEKDPWEPGEYVDPSEDETDFIPGPSKYYPDQNIDKWAVANVNKAHEYGLMSGTAKGWFEPQREITRAEFTTIVCRILGLDTEADFDQKFTDVKPSDWHYKYVMAAHQAGYVNGMSETTFAPSNYITREEIAVMVSRILNVTGNEADVYQFADGTSVAAWARIYVAAVNQTGIMKGDQFNQFLPKSKVNRQTVATIAVRLYEYIGNN